MRAETRSHGDAGRRRVQYPDSSVRRACLTLSVRRHADAAHRRSDAGNLGQIGAGHRSPEVRFRRGKALLTRDETLALGVGRVAVARRRGVDVELRGRWFGYT
jgi:hypothetical protein